MEPTTKCTYTGKSTRHLRGSIKLGYDFVARLRDLWAHLRGFDTPLGHLRPTTKRIWVQFQLGYDCTSAAGDTVCLRVNALLRSHLHSGRKLKAAVLYHIDLGYFFVWFKTHIVM